MTWVTPAALARSAIFLPTLVADDHESRETETASALHNLGHAIDVDKLIDELVALFAIAAAAALVVPLLSVTRHIQSLPSRASSVLTPPL